ncbi:MAG: hypothetical protein SFV32_02750 [Opitutaceae bacterium]|nr:hypothetical protein [Opitutaceae bacterium]
MRGALFVALACGVFLLWRRLGSIPPEELADKIPASAALSLLAFGPLLAMPVSWLHVLTGLRFGFWPGLAAVAVTTVIHIVGGWLVCRMKPHWVPARLQSWRSRLNGAGGVESVLICTLTPGMPYIVELYVLPAIGVPLRVLASLGTPINTARAVVTLLVGDIASDLSPGRVAILAGYYAILVSVSAYSLHRLRRRMKAAPAA